MNINKAVSDIKKFDWQTVINVATSLSCFNDRLNRFQKAYIIESIIEKCSNDSTFKYVDSTGYDYLWDKHKVRVELKSQVNESDSIYNNRNGKIRKNFTIHFQNGYNTDKVFTLSKSDIPELLLIVRGDGVVAIKQEDLIKFAHKKGADLHVTVPGKNVIEITGKCTKTKDYSQYYENLKNSYCVDLLNPFQNNP